MVHPVRYSRVAMLALTFAFMAATVAHSQAQAAVRCEWLFSTASAERDRDQAKPDVLPADARGEQTGTWLRNSFFDILEHFPFSSPYHSPRFLALDGTLVDAGFRRGNVEVREHRPGSFEVRVLYKNPHPTILDRDMTVEVKIYFFTSHLMAESNGGPTFNEQNFAFRVIGITNSQTNVSRRDRGRAETATRFYRNFVDSGNRFDSTRSHPWTDHLRTVLDEILIPLALGNPAIMEVGIGFDPTSHMDSSGRYSSTPQLLINRARGYFYPTAVSAALLPRNEGRIELDSVHVVDSFIDRQTEMSVSIPNRSKYLIVFDEMLDRNPQGSMIAVDRTTGERHPLYFRPASQTWTFDKPVAAEVRPAPKYNLSKLNFRLGTRVKALERGGGNPRVKVSISRNGDRGASHETRVVSVREAAQMSLEADVVSVFEQPF